ncbi:TPA: hypothetical protein N0F65_008613 [Lagenidium giganteum]|uniref:N-alpha-acetyltransferase 40 n=1 Tax=Lagenidium giganteum TaxID=4803 RepID=A0AAV2Z0C4_9STRA|nr:TPA: hypothetical protein N0F65_008613 [Lagenidium giganteum]
MAKKSKSKKQQTQQAAPKATTASAKHSPVQAVLDAANAVQDVMVDFQAFARYTRHNLQLSVVNHHAVHLNAATKSTVFALFEANMKELYIQSSWGYDPAAKETELFEDDARYLIVRDTTREDDAMVAFVHFRFVDDDGVQVLYIYDIQVADCMQRKGLGKFLVQVLQLVARKHGMKLVVLTVFKHNTSAMQFYREKLGFQIDETSPSASGDMTQSYEILSKAVDPSYR